MKITLDREEIEEVLISYIRDKCAALNEIIQEDSQEWVVCVGVEEGLDPELEEITEVYFSVEYN